MIKIVSEDRKITWKRLLPEMKKPDFWFDTSKKLENSALVLKKNRELYGLLTHYNTERMLLGFGLENYMRAIEIKKNGEIIDEEGILLSNTDHNLLEIIKKFKIDLSIEEEDYLELLSYCAQWAGRYPYPLKPNRKMPQQPVIRRSLTNKINATKNDKVEGILDNYPWIELSKHPNANEWGRETKTAQFYGTGSKIIPISTSNFRRF